MTTIVLKLSQSQLKNSALVAAGMNPAALAIKPGTRVEKSRKALSKRGYQKHKGRMDF